MLTGTNSAMPLLDKAQHNEQAANLLLENRFYDWVITTAFYSAVCYVDAAIFPLVDSGGGTYQDMDSYARAKNATKHTIRRDLVRKHLAVIKSQFQRLFDQSQTARYHSYQATEFHAGQALLNLQMVKNACLSRIRERAA